jgi:hypothetical protein
LPKGALRHAVERSVQPTVCSSNGAGPFQHQQLQLSKGGSCHAGEYSVHPTVCSSNGAGPVCHLSPRSQSTPQQLQLSKGVLRHAGERAVHPTVCSSNGACPVWRQQLRLSKGGMRHAGEQSVQPTVCTSNGACPVWHRSPRSQSTPQLADNLPVHRTVKLPRDADRPTIAQHNFTQFCSRRHLGAGLRSRRLTSPADRGRHSQSILQLPCHEGCFFRHR